MLDGHDNDQRKHWNAIKLGIELGKVIAEEKAILWQNVFKARASLETRARVREARKHGLLLFACLVTTLRKKVFK